ncbi:hypothetical protein IK146_00765 [Candidatus Saccharibacteria bacterium]|nr:hypothetical protein [Candidatus Saccharibacteria bacterium]
MRKSTKIMAGLGVVAGLGVALAPLATFADAQDVVAGTDTLNVTVLQGCSLTPRDGDSYQAWSNTYSTQVTPGDPWSITAGSGNNVNSVSINCNAGARYSVSATGTTLTKGSDTLPAYKVAVNGGSYVTLGTDTELVTATTITTSPVTFTVNGYQGTTLTTTPAGTYTGTVTYTVHFLDAA